MGNKLFLGQIKCKKYSLDICKLINWCQSMQTIQVKSVKSEYIRLVQFQFISLVQ